VNEERQLYVRVMRSLGDLDFNQLNGVWIRHLKNRRQHMLPLEN